MKKALLIIIICLLPMALSAQLYACRDSVKDSYDFWLYVPKDYNPSVCEKPVVIFLHGKSLCGNDLNQVRQYGCIDALEMGRTIDAFVIAPQAQGAWNPQKVMQIYDWAKQRYTVDTNRLYVLGMSMGGYGTIDFTATYPDRVAAAVALCGGATKKQLCGLNEVPLWIVHGTADNLVPVRASDRVVDSMCMCGDTSLLIFDRLEKINHSQLAGVFYLDQTYEWLFSHSLSDSIKTSNHIYPMNKEILDKAFKGLRKTNLDVKDSRPKRNKALTDLEYYYVKKGDNLSSIAAKHHTTVDKICTLNHIQKESVLRIGQKLRLK
jgi:predicted esterase/LysM repeat protein